MTSAPRAKSPATVAVIGATGAVGAEMLACLEQRKFPVAKLKPFASERSVGKRIAFAGGEAVIEPLNADAFDGVDIALFASSSGVSKQLAPEAVKRGAIVIDNSSAYRYDDNIPLVVPEVNGEVLAKHEGLIANPNCTAALMTMALKPLHALSPIQRVIASTYQAASGAGAAKMLELMQQMDRLTAAAKSAPADALQVEKAVTAEQRGASMPVAEFGAPLAGSLLGWIDSEMPGGQTREEWKGEVETNKILGTSRTIPVDGICVRIGTLRCHSQALTVKLTRDVPIGDIESILAGSTPWTTVVPNNKLATIRDLTPTAVTGTLAVPVGRLHKLRMGPEYLGTFTVGDQLLWGAAEPLRRMLRILREHHGHALPAAATGSPSTANVPCTV